MLTGTSEPGGGTAVAALQGELSAAGGEGVTGAGRGRLARVLRVEWLGQTAASLCWIASVFTYGITSAGDWLQLCAASAWLLANVAAAVGSEAD